LLVGPIAWPIGARAFENAIPEAAKFADRPKRKGPQPTDLGLAKREVNQYGDESEGDALKMCKSAPNCFSTTGDPEFDAGSLLKPWKAPPEPPAAPPPPPTPFTLPAGAWVGISLGAVVVLIACVLGCRLLVACVRRAAGLVPPAKVLVSQAKAGVTQAKAGMAQAATQAKRNLTGEVRAERRRQWRLAKRRALEESQSRDATASIRAAVAAQAADAERSKHGATSSVFTQEAAPSRRAKLEHEGLQADLLQIQNRLSILTRQASDTESATAGGSKHGAEAYVSTVEVVDFD